MAADEIKKAEKKTGGDRTGRVNQRVTHVIPQVDIYEDAKLLRFRQTCPGLIKKGWASM